MSAYALSKDGKGLLIYVKHSGKGSWLHIHGNELTSRERKIKNKIHKSEK